MGNRLDKVLNKYNESVDIRKTYDVILSKLQQERINYERTLQNMEKKLRDKNCDVKELLTLTKQAQTLKQETQKKLEMAQNGEELSTMSNIVPVEKNLTLSSDLQHDLNQTKN